MDKSFGTLITDTLYEVAEPSRYKSFASSLASVGVGRDYRVAEG